MLVPSEGNPQSKLWFIGEAPGREEEMQHKLFVGGAGRTLDSLLGEAGITRTHCYLDNVMQIRPPANNFKVFYNGKKPTDALTLNWHRIRNDIKQHKPNIVVPLGNEPMMAVLGNKGVGHWRGSVLWSEELGCKVMPTYHPSYIMRGNWSDRPIVVMDLMRALKESATPTHTPTERKLIVPEGIDECLHYIKEAEQTDLLAFDLETLIGVGWITAYGFSHKPNEGVSIRLEGRTDTELIILLRAIAALQDTNIPKVAHNAQFDIPFMSYFYHIQTRNLWMDTLAAHHCVYPQLLKSLDLCTSIYTDQPYYKHWAKVGCHDHKYYEYNAMDACVTRELVKPITEDLNESGLFEIYQRYDNALMIPLFDMQTDGINIDEEGKNRLVKAMEAEEKELQIEIDKIVGHPLNLNSSPQKCKYLYEELGHPKQFKAGALTSNIEAITKLSIKFPNPVFDKMIKASHIHKLLSNWLSAPLAKGRMHTSYLIGNTKTWRLASSKSAIGSGTNFQNVPPACRFIYIPDSSEYVFIDTDLRQAEFREVAYQAEQQNLIDIFADPTRDVFDEMTDWRIHCGLENVPKTERDKTKRTVHAGNYGMGEQRYVAIVGVVLSEARQLRALYKQTFPNIFSVFQAEVRDELYKTRTLSTFFGRKHTFLGIIDSILEDAYAFVPQSTIGDLLNQILIRIYYESKLRDLPFKLRLQVHDSMVTQVPKKRVDDYLELQAKCFDFPITVKYKTFVIPYSTDIKLNWSEVVNSKIENSGEVS